MNNNPPSPSNDSDNEAFDHNNPFVIDYAYGWQGGQFASLDLRSISPEVSLPEASVDVNPAVTSFGFYRNADTDSSASAHAPSRSRKLKGPVPSDILNCHWTKSPTTSGGDASMDTDYGGDTTTSVWDGEADTSPISRGEVDSELNVQGSSMINPGLSERDIVEDTGDGYVNMTTQAGATQQNAVAGPSTSSTAPGPLVEGLFSTFEHEFQLKVWNQSGVAFCEEDTEIILQVIDSKGRFIRPYKGPSGKIMLKIEDHGLSEDGLKKLVKLFRHIGETYLCGTKYTYGTKGARAITMKPSRIARFITEDSCFMAAHNAMLEHRLELTPSEAKEAAEEWAIAANKYHSAICGGLGYSIRIPKGSTIVNIAYPILSNNSKVERTPTDIVTTRPMYDSLFAFIHTLDPKVVMRFVVQKQGPWLEDSLFFWISASEIELNGSTYHSLAPGSPEYNIWYLGFGEYNRELRGQIFEAAFKLPAPNHRLRIWFKAAEGIARDHMSSYLVAIGATAGHDWVPSKFDWNQVMCSFVEEDEWYPIFKHIEAKLSKGSQVRVNNKESKNTKQSTTTKQSKKSSSSGSRKRIRVSTAD